MIGTLWLMRVTCNGPSSGGGALPGTACRLNRCCSDATLRGVIGKMQSSTSSQTNRGPHHHQVVRFIMFYRSCTCGSRFFQRFCLVFFPPGLSSFCRDLKITAKKMRLSSTLRKGYELLVIGGGSGGMGMARRARTRCEYGYC